MDYGMCLSTNEEIRKIIRGLLGAVACHYSKPSIPVYIRHEYFYLCNEFKASDFRDFWPYYRFQQKTGSDQFF
jgi:hypothetical protein